MSLTPIRFTVRKKGGALSGQPIEHLVAEFDWVMFKNTPNAEGFVRKAYYAAAQKLVRELHERKNQTEEHHLQSMENLIARSLKFTREEIEEWCECRDWSRAKFKDDVDAKKAIGRLKEHLPGMSSSEYAFPDKLRIRAAEIVAEVADSKSDPVADYLFVKLSQEQTSDDLIDL
ncbi:MAG: hypothetical protein D4S02_09945 [Rhodocyclaceae bacterium]|nr:MAG: hypothetical protein D4S02_09945 [Rhodocyclaceae bacterium]